MDLWLPAGYGPWILLAYGLWVILAFGVKAVVGRRSRGDFGVRLGSPSLVRWAGAGGITAGIGLGLLGTVVGPALWSGAADPQAVRLTVGGVGFLAGAVGSLAAQRAMGTSWRMGVEPGERTELVTTGPFALVRNPFFSMVTLLGWSVAVLCPTWPALAGAVILTVGVNVQVRLVEEPALRAVHGAAYEGYVRRTGRFVPRWRRRARAEG